MKTINQITVDRKGLVRDPQTGQVVSGFTPVEFLQVGELYVETRQIRGAFGVTDQPFGNARNIVADTAMEAAEKVVADYDDLLKNARKLSLPIPQSYIDRWGTGME